jgi:G3E family GTPase
MIAIEYLISQENSQLDYLIIETNGLADPSAVK